MIWFCGINIETVQFHVAKNEIMSTGQWLEMRLQLDEKNEVGEFFKKSLNNF